MNKSIDLHTHIYMYYLGKTDTELGKEKTLKIVKTKRKPKQIVNTI